MADSCLALGHTSSRFSCVCSVISLWKTYLESQRTISVESDMTLYIELKEANKERHFAHENGTSTVGSLILRLRDLAMPQYFVNVPIQDQNQRTERLAQHLNAAERIYQEA